MNKTLFLFRPIIFGFSLWTLITFSIGLAFLLYGALNYHIPDWDIGVSLCMAMLTLLTAQWSASVLFDARWKMFPVVIFVTWFTVDGVYLLYHTFAGNTMFREAQWLASLCLYYLCGFIWLLGEKFGIYLSLRQSDGHKI